MSLDIALLFLSPESRSGREGPRHTTSMTPVVPSM